MRLLRHTLALVALLTAVGLVPGPARAVTAPGTATLDTEGYAVCAGRLTAVTEHSWLTQDPLAPAMELRRDWLNALFRAALKGAEAEGSRASALRLLRIRSKRQLTRLLDTRASDHNARRTQLAASMAARQVMTCHTMLTR